MGDGAVDAASAGQGGYGVFRLGATRPEVVFAHIEAAIAWGLFAHGHANFQVRWAGFTSLQPERAADQARNVA